MTGKLVISLDFELMWGVRDHRSVSDYGKAVLGAREAIPGMLDCFSRHGIGATWATVGLLFARNRDEALDYAPSLRPSYENMALSQYDFIENGLGKNEAEDPHHFGRSLVERIRDTEGQELACHTFSHYFCLEPGQTLEQFEADLKAARSIASSIGVTSKSIVFPRNQWTPAHVEIAGRTGLQCFRGSQDGLVYRPRSGKENTLPIRGLRLIDSVLPIAARNDHGDPPQVAGLRNVAASRFYRTSANAKSTFASLHLRRVMKEMERSARDGRTYHLWWHPHNFGSAIEPNLDRLEKIARHFVKLRDRYGMTSETMAQVAGSPEGEPAASNYAPQAA